MQCDFFLFNLSMALKFRKYAKVNNFARANI